MFLRETRIFATKTNNINKLAKLVTHTMKPICRWQFLTFTKCEMNESGGKKNKM